MEISQLTGIINQYLLNKPLDIVNGTDETSVLGGITLPGTGETGRFSDILTKILEKLPEENATLEDLEAELTKAANDGSMQNFTADLLKSELLKSALSSDADLTSGLFNQMVTLSSADGSTMGSLSGISSLIDSFEDISQYSSLSGFGTGVSGMLGLDALKGLTGDEQ